MLFSGQAFQLTDHNGVLELCFDSQNEKVNVFNRTALSEFAEVLNVIESQKSAKGLVMTSAKSVFVAGADITEFLDYFQQPDEVLRNMLDEVNGMFNRLEDLPFPTVAAINGEAQGGGFEVCLACDFRVAGAAARVGLPEVKLGIMPGWGGSVRLPRLIGVDNAIEWMCAGGSKRPAAALSDGAVDAVVADDALRQAAFDLVADANAGKFDFQKRRAIKKNPLILSQLELTMAIESAKGVVGAKAGPHYPSPLTIIDTVAAHGTLARDAALPLESDSFLKLAKTDVAASLVGIYLNDQLLKRIARKQTKAAGKVDQAAVLGAGIMGGGVAYQSASNGVPILMKDIAEPALEAGLEEAGKLLQKQIQRGRLKPAGMADILNAIQPALSYGEFGDVDLVVEAVVENPKVKMSVLAEVEGEVTDDTIITTNTSTISVDLLSSALKRCPGFLVNRILFAYFGGFNKLMADGGDHLAIDKTMERFGWPMGPAYLLDVVGMDTGKHAAGVMAEGFPDRMSSESDTIIDAMFKAERLGQKNGKGFYRYEPDRKGRPQKLVDEDANAIVASVQSAQREMDQDEIIDRMMIPMCIESVRCLEDDIVSTPAEVDMGLVYGIGFPPFRGGVLRYIDKMGLETFCAKADSYKALGPLYHPTDKMREMAKAGTRFHAASDTGESA